MELPTNKQHSCFYPPTYIRTVWFSFYLGAPYFIAFVVHTPTVTSWFLALHSFETSVIAAFRRKHNGKVCRPCTCLHLVFYAKTSLICKRNKDLFSIKCYWTRTLWCLHGQSGNLAVMLRYHRSTLTGKIGTVWFAFNLCVTVNVAIFVTTPTESRC